MKKILAYWPLIIVVIILIYFGSIFYAKKQSQVILFYSTSCPHCQVVEKYISENQLRDKFKFSELEVSGSEKNTNKLIEKSKQCGLDINRGIGVPLLFDGQTCYQGDTDIINYFSTQLNK